MMDAGLWMMDDGCLVNLLVILLQNLYAIFLVIILVIPLLWMVDDG